MEIRSRMRFQSKKWSALLYIFLLLCKWFFTIIGLSCCECCVCDKAQKSVVEPLHSTVCSDLFRKASTLSSHPVFNSLRHSLKVTSKLYKYIKSPPDKYFIQTLCPQTEYIKGQEDHWRLVYVYHHRKRILLLFVNHWRPNLSSIWKSDMFSFSL